MDVGEVEPVKSWNVRRALRLRDLDSRPDETKSKSASPSSDCVSDQPECHSGVEGAGLHMQLIFRE